MTKTVDSARPRRGRRILGALIVLLGIAVLVAVTSPLWFPWIVSPLARQFGFQADSIERRGLSGIRLTQVAGRIGAARVEARTVDLVQPLVWLLRVVNGGANSTPALAVNDWRVIVQKPQTNATTPSATNIIASLLDGASESERWLGWLAGGGVQLTQGEVVTDSMLLLIPSVRLGPDGLDASVTRDPWSGDIRVRLESDGALRLGARLRPGDVVLESELRRTNALLSARGTLSQSSNVMTFSALFDDSSTLPRHAELRGNNLVPPLPANFPGVVAANAAIEWQEGQGTVAISARGETRLANATMATPISAELLGNFTPEQFHITQLQIESQPVNAQLSNPVSIPLSPPWRVPAANLRAEVELGALGLGDLQGRLTGLVSSEPGPAAEPRLRIEARGQRVQFRDVAIEEAEVLASLQETNLSLQSFDVRFSNGSALSASGSADWKQENLRDLTWQFDGEIPVNLGMNQWWEAPPSLQGRGSFQGPFTNLLGSVHVLTLEPARTRGLRPIRLELEGQSRGFAAEAIQLKASTETGMIEVAGSARWTNGPQREIRVNITRAEILHGATNALSLLEPFALGMVSSQNDPSTRPPRFELSPIRLRGQAGEIELSGAVTWPRQGRGEVRMERIVPNFLADWFTELPLPVNDPRVRDLDLAAEWTDGIIQGKARWDLEAKLSNLGVISSKGELTATPDGVRLAGVSVTQDEKAGLTATLQIPVTGSIATGRLLVQPIADKPLQGSIVIPRQGTLWEILQQRFPVQWSGPEAEVTLAGDLEAPRAVLSLSAHALNLKLPSAETNSLSFENLDVKVLASREALVLEHLRFQYKGQEARLTGKLPIHSSADRPWQDLRLGDWREADLEAVITHAELGPLLETLRDAFQPMGALSANLQLHQGAMQGWVQVSNIATRPLPPVGVVRDVALRLELQNQRVEIRQGSASINGQPVSLAGWIEAQAERDLTGDVRVTGTNVALVRSTGALLRADLDVAVVRTNTSTTPAITGVLTLRDSVVMMDFRDFLSVNLERPEQRPPYFSIEKAPFADWNLDLRVRGDHFAKVLSPAFRGTVSVDTRLLGSLQNPRLLGEGVIDAGQILFPFGQLKVEQARVRFTEAKPYQPQLEGKAEGLNFGYTISLDIDGTLDDPELRFTSVPPLSTREALQMLTAGTLPRSEYSFSDAQRIQKVGTYLATDLVSNITGDPSTEPRLSFRSGQRVTSNGRLTYGVEYRITDRWYLVGEYDRWSQFNAGVRWRVLEK